MVLFSQVWGDATELPESGASGYCEVTLDPPITMNREVRICVEYYGGNATDYCRGAYYTGDKITGEFYTNYYHYGGWHDIGEAEEGSYYLSYIPVASPLPVVETEEMSFWSVGAISIIVAIVGIAVVLWRVYQKKRNKKTDESLAP